MKSKFRQIISGFALITVLVLAVTAVSQAAASGKNTYINIDDLRRAGSSAVGSYVGEIGKTTGNINLEGNKYSPYLYCIQKGKALSKATYTVKHYIEITGKTAYIDGITNKGYVSEDNLTLAYILGGGNDDTYGRGFGTADPGTMRQNALWAFWNTWATTAHKNFGLENYSWNAQQAINDTNNATEIGMNNDWAKRNALNDEAEKKENRQGLVASIQILNSTSKTVSSVSTFDKEGKVNGEFIGPIKLRFTGDLSIENGKELEFYDENRTKLNGIGDIKSEEEFYIKNTSSSNVENLKFKVTSKGTLKARIWILENEKTTGQRLIVADSEHENTEKDLTITVQRQEEGNIQIHKQDESTKENLQGAEFKVYIVQKDAFLSIDKTTGEYIYEKSIDNAQEFKTDKEGIANINNIVTVMDNSKTNVIIYETKAPTNYELNKQKGYGYEYKSGEAVYNSNVNRVWCNYPNIYTITPNTTNDLPLQIDIGNSRTGELEIIKKDAKNNDIKLSRAEFKISVKEGDKSKETWLKLNDDGTYSYSSNYENATAFTTKEEGNVKLEKLEPGTYYIYETKAPTGYDITAQENYDSRNGWVDCGKADVPSGKLVEVPLTNDKLISLEGYVWIEKPGSKANEYNDILDNGEDIITDQVTITLRNKSNNGVVASNPKLIKEVYNGIEVICYKFEKIEYDKLGDYYVQFDYSEKYKDYITVTPNFDIAEGSKALVDQVPDYDKDLFRVASTYRFSKDESKYGLSGLATKFYNENTYTLENINLGIKQIKDPEFTVSDTLAYIDMSIKGYNYRYYQGEKAPANITAPTVRLQSETDADVYTRAIAPADILYSNKDITKELKVYVTYRIDVTNTTQLEIPYLYQEEYLNVKSVNVTFDTDRYTLVDENDGKTLIDNRWTLNSNGGARLDLESSYLKDTFYKDGKGIPKDTAIDEKTQAQKNQRYVYIKLKIKDAKLKELLTLGENQEQREKQATKAQVIADHEYTRIDSSWGNYTKYGIPQQKQTHYTKEETEEDPAAFLALRLGQNRTITGTVFKDSKVEKDANGKDRSSETIGNGKYDNNENTVEGVIVELGNYENNEFKATNLYQVDENGKAIIYEYDEKGEKHKVTVNTSNEEEIRKKLQKGEYGDIFNKATAKTDANGTYSFEGVVPGEYFIRFTYGDGTQIIRDENGNEVNKVSSNEYKSTIVTSEVKDAFTKYNGVRSSYDQKIGNGTATWYMNLEKNSLAVDDLAQRKALSEGKYEVTVASIEKRKENASTAITAETPLITVPIENTETILLQGDQYKKEFKDMDFGIIELPKTRIDISKKITNIKLTLQNGQTLLDGNPATQNLAYTTDLDKKTNGGSTYVKVELESDYIYGGTLEIKYEIEVVNHSDLDYIENENSVNYGHYYKYGEITADAHEKQLTIDNVYDYLDPKLSYASKEGNQKLEIRDITALKEQSEETLTAEQQAKRKEILDLVKAQEDETRTFKQILDITDWKKLSSSKGKDSANSSDKVIINANKLLSSGEDDLEFINVAEVVKVTTEPITIANVELTSVETRQQTQIGTIGITSDVKLTVTPSTGGNRSILYFAIGTIALVALAGGIVIIKKEVLK